MDNAIVRWFDGKKMWTGAALVALPPLLATVTSFLADVGVAEPVQVFGYALVAMGFAHKVVKFLDDLTPDHAIGPELPKKMAVTSQGLLGLKVDWKTLLKKAVDIIVWGRAKGYWDQKPGPTLPPKSNLPKDWK